MNGRIAVALFPGTNCEHDIVHAFNSFGSDAEIVYHDENDLSRYDGVIIPGGFAHGDYLRTGAIARFSPIMSEIERFAKEGKPVLGICNGFQILTEAHLLDGALQKNIGMKFLCTDVELEVCAHSPLTSRLEIGQRVTIPINHFEGNYTCDDDTYDRLVSNDQIILRYITNLNGSRNSIAGITNAARNVIGLMPHPERASGLMLGSDDGIEMIRSFIDSVNLTQSISR